ncbi:MAG: hypothetical protein QNK11_02540 [Legionella sp.]|nr:hypothetical protein [Legionella sp.]
MGAIISDATWKDCLTIVGENAETAAYVTDEFKNKSIEARVPKDIWEPLHEKFKEFEAELIEAQALRESRIWAGQKAEAVVASELASELVSEPVTPEIEEKKQAVSAAVSVTITLDEAGVLGRKYLINGESPDDATTDKLDEHIHGWLEGEQLEGKKGLIYETNEQGESVQMNVAALRERLKSDKSGLQQYLQAKGVDIKEVKVPEKGPDLDDAPAGPE